MWVVFIGNDYDIIKNLRCICTSKEKAIEEAAEYAFNNQQFLNKKTKEWFKDRLISKLNDYTIAMVDFSNVDFIVYNHVGITLVPMGD